MLSLASHRCRTCPMRSPLSFERLCRLGMFRSNGLQRQRALRVRVRVDRPALGFLQRLPVIDSRSLQLPWLQRELPRLRKRKSYSKFAWLYLSSESLRGMDCGFARGGTSHTPGHPWNLRSPCRRERPSVPVKATLQRDDANSERLVASDHLPYKSNEFGILPVNPIVRTLAFQILTGIDGSGGFFGSLFGTGRCRSGRSGLHVGDLHIRQSSTQGSMISNPRAMDALN